MIDENAGYLPVTLVLRGLASERLVGTVVAKQLQEKGLLQRVEAAL